MTGAFDRQIAEFERELRRVLVALASYSNEIVLIGGWVPVLYRKYGGLSDWQGPARLTREADLLLRESILNAGQRRDISDLLTREGLRPVSLDSSEAAVWRGSGPDGAEVEFFVDGMHRKQQTVSVVGQVGLAALSLPDVGLMWRHRQILKLDPLDDQPAVEVSVPLLGAFAVNKARTCHERRSTAAAGERWVKDLISLYDLMAAGGIVTRRLFAEAAAIVERDEDARRMTRGACERLRAFLAEATDDEWRQMVAVLLDSGEFADAGSATAALEGRLTDLTEFWRGLT